MSVSRKGLLAALAVLVLAFMAAPLLLHRGEKSPQAEFGLPWQIELLPNGGSRVFGLALGSDTLADARARLGAELQVAIIARRGEAGTLEAYLPDARASYVTGKLILNLDAAPELVRDMLARSGGGKYMDSGAGRFNLSPADQALALQRPLAAISFIPSVDLDEATILQRFGAPSERIRVSDDVEHFLYADKGLDIALDTRGKELLQYVPPREFARLRAPLAAKRAP
ncbi:MAG: hypothetical protein KF778_14060 [Rhodocyclaceae bacterium]|nr:hypothetical protein [Rhodocyclaceae bacterium]MBX3669519.1 hypothetical protein [Rhodocyclaceae bacterium]